MFRLQLEPLETREVPAILALGGTTESRDGGDYSAIAFVGGWGSSMYQYAHTDPSSALAPSEQLALNFAKVEFVEPLPVLLVLADRQHTAPPPASDYLLVLDGIQGDSRAAHRETIEVVSWSFDAPAPTVDGRIITVEN